MRPWLGLLVPHRYIIINSIGFIVVLLSQPLWKIKRPTWLSSLSSNSLSFLSSTAITSSLFPLIVIVSVSDNRLTASPVIQVHPLLLIILQKDLAFLLVSY